MKRQIIINHINKKYNVKLDYLWDKFPNYAAFRHKANEKWFALLMDISADKLNLDENKELHVLNVKCQPEFIHGLMEKKYIYPAYHMNKEHWVSILLEQVDPHSNEHIYELIQDSFNLITN